MTKRKTQPKTIKRAAKSSTSGRADTRLQPRDTWAFILDVLAELGRGEIARREAAEHEQTSTSQEQER